MGGWVGGTDLEGYFFDGEEEGEAAVVGSESFLREDQGAGGSVVVFWGGWVGGWVGIDRKIEENEAVGMSC